VSEISKFARAGQGWRAEHGCYSHGERAALLCCSREFDARGGEALSLKKFDSFRPLVVSIVSN
jgi:hypothetical protein